jgi:hypothetical protein
MPLLTHLCFTDIIWQRYGGYRQKALSDVAIPIMQVLRMKPLQIRYKIRMRAINYIGK